MPILPVPVQRGHTYNIQPVGGHHKESTVGQTDLSGGPA